MPAAPPPTGPDPPHRRFELLVQARSTLAHAVEQAAVDELVEHRESDGARQRRTVPRVAVLEFARALGERVVDVLPAEHRREREVAGPEPLPRADDVRLDRQPLVCEPAPRPAHARHDLVEADEEAVPLAPLG